MAVTDPMHTFLLGMVKKETYLNLELLNRAQHDSGESKVFEFPIM